MVAIKSVNQLRRCLGRIGVHSVFGMNQIHWETLKLWRCVETKVFTTEPVNTTSLADIGSHKSVASSTRNIEFLFSLQPLGSWHTNPKGCAGSEKSVGWPLLGAKVIGPLWLSALLLTYLLRTDPISNGNAEWKSDRRSGKWITTFLASTGVPSTPRCCQSTT